MKIHRCPCLNVSLHILKQTKAVEFETQPTLDLGQFCDVQDPQVLRILHSMQKATLGIGSIKKEFEELTSIHQVAGAIRVLRCDNCLTNYAAIVDGLQKEEILLNMDLLVGDIAYEERLQHPSYSKAFRIILDEESNLPGHEGSYILPNEHDKIEKKLSQLMVDCESIQKRLMKDRIEVYTRNQMIFFKKHQTANAFNKKMLITRMSDQHRKRVDFSLEVGENVSSLNRCMPSYRDPFTTSSLDATTPLSPLIPIKLLKEHKQNVEPVKSQQGIKSIEELTSANGKITKGPQNANASIPPISPTISSDDVFSFEEELMAEDGIRHRGKFEKNSCDQIRANDFADSSSGDIRDTIAAPASKQARAGGSAGTTPLGSSLPISIPASIGKERDEEDDVLDRGKERLMPHQIAESMYEYSASFGTSRRNMTMI
eukprot:TRINITY_DN581_c0_g1_i1.p1 TRINITY_DN581_c0_g1~~TRINITY_DN581_c0_g1_i1.p1  ORF type:complete len:429 (-),score=90.49 TRINITY_DN581_c0_g1_i1:402-1688(-)